MTSPINPKRIYPIQRTPAVLQKIRHFLVTLSPTEPKLMSKKFCRGVAFMLALVLASTGLMAKTAAKPAAQYTLAVLPLEIDGRISVEEGAALTSRLSAEMAATEIFIITDQSVVESTMQTAGLSATGCGSVDCGMQAGKLLSTQLVVNGSIRQVGQLYFIEAQMIHSNSGQVVQKVSEDFDGDFERLLNFMPVVARKLVGKSASSKTVSDVSEVQSASAPERSGMTSSSDAYDGNPTGTAPSEGWPAPTNEVRNGSNKFLYIGLATVGVAGAIYGITQLTKDSDNKNDGGKTGPTTDLPNPPKFP
jgi:TolB-like protein